MKFQNIYHNNNLPLKNSLSEHKPNQLLFVPIEIGKFNHKSHIVNFFGDVITKPFDFSNNKHGLKFFVKKLESALKSTSAKKVFLGCESTGHYHLNLVYQLKQLKFPVEIINPRDSRMEKPNKNSKTDIIDLNAISRVLISNKGSRQIVPDGIYYNLQRASRTRRKFVSRRISSQNIITGLIDRIFPDLWDKDNSIFSDRWGKASLLMIEHYPHPQHIIRLGENRLARFFRKHNTKLGTKTATKVLSAANNSIPKPADELQMDIYALKAHLRTYKLYKELISDLEQEIACLLVQTPGTFLLSVSGISITYASEFTAEVGDINRFAYANQIISFAGTCPRIFESAEYQAQHLPISKRGSGFLRTSLNQIALDLNKWLPPFHEYYSRKAIENPGKKGIARTATGNKFVKLAFALMKRQQLYRPIGIVLDEKAYYCSLWDKILGKLSRFDLSSVPMDNNFLLKIKKHMEANYGMTLTLQSQDRKGYRHFCCG